LNHYFLQVSNINAKEYLIATVFGLFPAQIINVYLGSTLRSMEEVLSNKSTAATGFIVFFQVSHNCTLHKYTFGIVRSHISFLLSFSVHAFVKEYETQDEYSEQFAEYYFFRK
jgi:protein maelstrom